MYSRLRWVGVVALIGVLVVAGGRGVVDAQGQGQGQLQPDRFPGDFVHAGRFTINKNRIDYLERGDRGQLYVYFTSKNSIVLNGDAAKMLLRAMGSDE